MKYLLAFALFFVICLLGLGRAVMLLAGVVINAP